MDWLDRLNLPPWALALIGGLTVLAVPFSRAARNWQMARAQAAQVQEMTDQSADLGQGWERLVKRLEQRVDAVERKLVECQEQHAECRRLYDELSARCAACALRGPGDA